MQINRAIIVGLFIFIGIGIFITVVLTLGDQRKTFVKTFTLRSVFEDVGGLQKGNNIWYSGVKVGTVKKIDFNPNSQVEVTMSIETKMKSLIRKDAKAKIGSDGLIGNKIVVIYGGTSAFQTVVNNDSLQGVSSIKSDDMLAMLQENNKNLLAITGNFKLMSQKIKDGEGTIGSLINDPALANNLKATVANFKAASVKTGAVIAGLDNFAAKLNAPGGFANQLVTDTMIIRNMRATVTQLHQAANNANQFTSDLKKVSKDLDKGNSAIGVLLHDETVASDLRSTIRNLNTSSQKLDQDLEAVQHNFLLRGFFRRKAKNKTP